MLLVVPCVNDSGQLNAMYYLNLVDGGVHCCRKK